MSQDEGVGEVVWRYAQKSFELILSLSTSEEISDVLLGFNAVLFIILFALGGAYLLEPPSVSEIGFGIILILAGILGFAVSILYIAFMELISNFAQDKVQALRTGVTTLFVDLTLMIAGVLFSNNFLVTTALEVIALQVLLVLISGFLKVGIAVPDRIVAAGQFKQVLGDLSSLITVIQFVAWLVLLVVKISIPGA